MGASLQQSGTGKSKHAASSEINVTPFVDVMLVLLIIFMVAAPLAAATGDMVLPKTEQAESKTEEADPLTVLVNKDGSLTVAGGKINDGKVVSVPGWDYLVPVLTQRAIDPATGQADYKQRFQVRGDHKRYFREIQMVLGRAYDAGFRKAALVAELPDS